MPAPTIQDARHSGQDAQHEVLRSFVLGGGVLGVVEVMAAMCWALVMLTLVGEKTLTREAKAEGGPSGLGLGAVPASVGDTTLTIFPPIVTVVKLAPSAPFTTS